jgi:hypothetical protein
MSEETLSRESAEQIVRETREWLEKAVIGLNLCPFARAVYLRDQVRFVVSPAETPADLLLDLADELHFLDETDPEAVDTTLIIHPHVLHDFLEYNDFLGDAEQTVEDLDFDGEIQVASFHPRYQFAGTEPDDIENFTNRSPYPMLHLLREASVSRAVESIPDPAQIYEANIEAMKRLGHEGWRRLFPGRNDERED